MRHEFKFSRWLLKPARDGRFQTKGIHVLLEIETLVVVFMQCLERLGSSFHWCLELTKFFSLEVAHLLRVPHIEVKLV